MTIQDNGRGFTPRARSFLKKRQLGLIAMRDRAELLGGQLQLFSSIGQGVRVVTTIPYHGHFPESTPEGGQEKHDRSNNNKHPRAVRKSERSGKRQSAKNTRRIKTIARG
jgi:hypothetical protein